MDDLHLLEDGCAVVGDQNLAILIADLCRQQHQQFSINTRRR
jgi:hypothetical protein